MNTNITIIVVIIALAAILYYLYSKGYLSFGNKVVETNTSEGQEYNQVIKNAADSSKEGYKKFKRIIM